MTNYLIEEESDMTHEVMTELLSILWRKMWTSRSWADSCDCLFHPLSLREWCRREEMAYPTISMLRGYVEMAPYPRILWDADGVILKTRPLKERKRKARGRVILSRLDYPVEYLNSKDFQRKY